VSGQLESFAWLGQPPMSFLNVKIHETVEAPRCVHCGGVPQLAIKMLDSKTNRTVRMFICECGDQT
jgi:hypothetical protein